MTFKPAARRTALLLLALVVAPRGTLAAMSASEVAEALVAADQATTGGWADYASAIAEGEDVVISGYRLGTPDGFRSDQARVVIRAPVPRDDGGFTTARIDYENAVVEFGLTPQLATIIGQPRDVRLTYREAIGRMEDVTVKGGGAKALDYARAVAVDLSIEGPRRLVLGSAKGMTYEFTDSGDRSRISLAVDAMAMNLDAIGRSLGDLGYGDRLTGAFKLAIGFDETEGVLDIETVALTADDIGTLTFAARVADLQDADLNAAGLGNEEQLLAIYTNGTLQSASPRFDNAGIVERLLDRQAKAAGISRTALAASLANALPFLLTGTIRDATFRTAFSGAVGAFLKNPQSIVIAGSPEKAPALAQVFFALENLPEVLSLRVINGR